MTAATTRRPRYLRHMPAIHGFEHSAKIGRARARRAISPWHRLAAISSPISTAATNGALIISPPCFPFFPFARPLKLLYARWHDPQLAESYIETERAYMSRRGTDVEVWSEITPLATHPVDVPVLRGSLKEALASAKPDIVHIHWLGSFGSYEHVLRKAGLPVTVRAHGFEFAPELASKLSENSLVRAVFVFPQHKAALPNFAKLQVACSAFAPTLYQPLNLPKDRRLLLPVAPRLPT